MKFLITGSGGQVGTEMCRILSRQHEILATFRETTPLTDCKTKKMDITDKKAVIKTLRLFKPDYIIHAAAMTNVDQCETQRELAYKINVEGTENIISNFSGNIIYLSTDFVFDGKKGNYKEYDKTNPVNYYGKTKLMGEEIVLKSGLPAIIIRTSTIYSSNPNTFNFVTWVMKELESKKQIRAVTDQVVSPTSVLNLAEIIDELIKIRASGIFHAAGSEKINRYDFALKIADFFNLERVLISPISTEELNQKAMRPKNSSLNIEKLKSAIKTPVLDINSGLKREYVQK